MYGNCVAFAGGKYDIPFGSDEMLLGALAVGGVGGVGSTYNYSGRVANAVIAAFQAGDMAAARAAQCATRSASSPTSSSAATSSFSASASPSTHPLLQTPAPPAAQGQDSGGGRRPPRGLWQRGLHRQGNHGAAHGRLLWAAQDPTDCIHCRGHRRAQEALGVDWLLSVVNRRGRVANN